MPVAMMAELGGVGAAPRRLLSGGQPRTIVHSMAFAESSAHPEMSGEAGRCEDCPWCGMGEGSVDDCHCGMRICPVCADLAEGVCECGWEL